LGEALTAPVRRKISHAADSARSPASAGAITPSRPTSPRSMPWSGSSCASPRNA